MTTDVMAEAGRLLRTREGETSGGPPRSRPGAVLDVAPRHADEHCGTVRALTRQLSEIQPEPVTWLSPGRIPFGKLTVLEGDPGLGKSTVLLDLAARLTRGESLPGDPGLAPADVILLTAEDGLADTVRPRLEAAGADCRRVHTLEGFIRDGGAPGEIVLGDPNNPGSLDALEQLIRDRGARLVIVDVLNAFLSGDRDAYSDHAMRAALRPLQNLAERTGCAVVVVRHLRKSPAGKAINAGGGSIGIAGAARSVLLVDTDPANDGHRVLASVKCNLAPCPPSLAFRIVSTDGGASRIEWLGVSQHTAESLTEARAGDQGEAGQRSKVEECAELLRDWLAPNGMERKEVLRLGLQAGFPERTVERARKVLGVPHRSVGFGASKRSMWLPPSFLPTGPIPASLDPIAWRGSNEVTGRNGTDAARFEDSMEREAIQSEADVPPGANQ